MHAHRAADVFTEFTRASQADRLSVAYAIRHWAVCLNHTKSRDREPLEISRNPSSGRAKRTTRLVRTTLEKSEHRPKSSQHLQWIAPVKTACAVEHRLHRGGGVSRRGAETSGRFGPNGQPIRLSRRPDQRPRYAVRESPHTAPTDAGTGPNRADSRGRLSSALSQNHKPVPFDTGCSIAGAGFEPTTSGL